MHVDSAQKEVCPRGGQKLTLIDIEGIDYSVASIAVKYML